MGDTDGGALSLGSDVPLGQCISVDGTFLEGIDAWTFLSGDPGAPDAIPLTMVPGEAVPTVSICHEHAP